MNKRLTVFIVLVFSNFLHTVEAVSDTKGSQESKQTDFDASYLSILGFGFAGGADISDIQKKLGPAPVLAGGTLCYTSDKPGDTTKLIFEVDNEMGLQKFKVLSAEKGPNSSKRKCVSSSGVSRMIETPSHLRLGMTVRELMDQLGPPTGQYEHSMRWSRSGEACQKLSKETIDWWKKNGKEIPASGCQKYGFDSVIEVTIKDGKITSFSVESGGEPL